MQWSLLIIGLYLVVWPSKAELWEKDMSKEVYIEASVEGLKGKVSHKKQIQYSLLNHVKKRVLGFLLPV